MPMGARVIEVIETYLERRGDGVKDPVRIITQYWSRDGKLLAEVDPCDGRSIVASVNSMCAGAGGADA